MITHKLNLTLNHCTNIVFNYQILNHVLVVSTIQFWVLDVLAVLAFVLWFYRVDLELLVLEIYGVLALPVPLLWSCLFRLLVLSILM